MIGIWAGHIEKGGIQGERFPGNPAESRSGAPVPIHCHGSTGFRALSHRGPWAGPVG